jgi:ribonuclease III
MCSAEARGLISDPDELQKENPMENEKPQTPKKTASMNEERWIEQAEEKLGYEFNSKDLLKEALTHRSFINENKTRRSVLKHNERLEFLGDAVLGFLTAERLYKTHVSADEGELTQRRAAYVSEQDLAARGLDVAFGDLVRMGKGQLNFGGGRLPSIISDAIEAVIGAVFLDGGISEASRVIQTLLGDPPDLAVPRLSAKTILQERAQKMLRVTPTYVVFRTGGPDHAPTFEAEVRIKDLSIGKTSGKSRQAATEGAANAALKRTAELSDAEFVEMVSSGNECP